MSSIPYELLLDSAAFARKGKAALLWTDYFTFSFAICASEGQGALNRWVGFPFFMIPIGTGRQKLLFRP